jgi:hypothetical protein
MPEARPARVVSIVAPRDAAREQLRRAGWRGSSIVWIARPPLGENRAS